jgi:2'-5' RNA ligase
VSPLPDRMRSRWLGREEPGAGQGDVYWHVLVRRHPELSARLLQAQSALAGFTGLHLTPPDCLHLTVLKAGSTREVSRAEMAAMVGAARRRLDHAAPIRVSFERVLFHPEAIAVLARPAGALLPMLEAAVAATREVTGRAVQIGDDGSGQWVPHVTIAYSTADQPAAPIISVLGRRIAETPVVVDSMQLVVQWGPERRWDWELVGSVRLSGGRPQLVGGGG